MFIDAIHERIRGKEDKQTSRHMLSNPCDSLPESIFHPLIIFVLVAEVEFDVIYALFDDSYEHLLWLDDVRALQFRLEGDLKLSLKRR